MMSRKPVGDGGKRDEIVGAALQLFLENGYDGTSVRSIMNQAGGEVGLFYYYFKNKDKVFDLQTAISFDGDTAPYIQYTYARCSSLLRKRTEKESIITNYSFFENPYAFAIIKEIGNFKQTIKIL